ncbi:PEP/pyruvate-binding domain-containing protein [Thermodesulfovibrio yellowstonii]|uniref:Probable phosphoenolpyruvate synthase/pyruvate phosphate dikinase n=1 Tax=Thermodesulfovibrio yellowstonii (strain ATCC 51303 / DSM 11347 / YP87) TaxID=289376 RepID=B5YLA1_THEYD|nr:PEP/pyruvate-binding domain-containing protein [Thermodesulfovibrio yellowstonii]ACI20473.1 probable phosphoenolpyruvate synthase/pyruvate phosphate dikinase [Thermodesulfovibrio yellowstonii DSM 11347]
MEMKQVIWRELEKISSIFSSYPGVLKNAVNLIEKLKHSTYSLTIAQEIENHYIKYAGFYLKNSHGYEATCTLINYLIQGFQQSDEKQAFLKAILKIIMKLLEEEEVVKNCSYRKIISDIFEYLNTIELYHYIPQLGVLKNIGKEIIKKEIKDSQLMNSFIKLYQKYIQTFYSLCLSIPSPDEYFKKFSIEGIDLIKPFCESLFKEIKTTVEEISKITDINRLLSLPSDKEIFNKFREIPKKLSDSGNSWLNLKVTAYYLLWIMENQQLREIHEFSLRELGRIIKNFLLQSQKLDIKKFLTFFDIVFSQFDKFFYIFPDAVMFSLEDIGDAVYKSNNKEILNSYIEHLILLGFHAPQFKGFYNNYTINVNRYHLINLKLWFNLISKNPVDSKDLISALCIYLFFGGIHVKDTDLFQREITKFLNSDISQIFYLVKPLLKKIPVYFNEINAEGHLRTVSTQVDEIFKRKDPLMHFIRKQIHVESSPLLVDVMEKIIEFWITGERKILVDYIPEEVLRELDFIDEHFKELQHLFERLLNSKEFGSIEKILSTSIDVIVNKIESYPVTDIIKTKAVLAIRLYQLLYAKYKTDCKEVESFLKEAFYHGLPDASFLIEVLSEHSLFKKVESTVTYLEILKNIIVSPEKYEAFEDITHKRHIVAGIPSVSGRYSERKFNALSVYLRLESLLNTLLDELEQSIDLSFITRATLFRIEKYLKLFGKILELNGISSQKYINTLSMLSVALEIRRFTFSQYMDIFRNFTESVSDIVNTYCTAPYKKWLKKIVIKISKNIKKTELEEFELINALSEKFLREMVVQYPGLSQLDRLISRIIKASYNQAEKLEYKDLDLLMTYDPKKILCDIYHPREEINDRIHLGNKGHNLIKLASKGISVPPGFILTTEVFRCKEAINNFEPVKEHLNKEIHSAIKRLEAFTKKTFGEASNPLLVSVRSGGAISMPGMMNSFLNVGINEKIIEGLIKQTGKPWFAWDSYRRFLQCWGMSFGLDRDEFDSIINEFKKKYKAELKIQFAPLQMKEVAIAYRDFILSKGIYIEEDPWKQLKIAISQVFNSWYSNKAKAYREILGISEDWGTAVVVQKMVFGNLDINAGSGVLFTRNPKESMDRLVLWGDYTTGAQGEDIVSGLVKTYPISIEQKIIEGRINEKSLEEAFPEIYESLIEIAERLIYKERWDHQEIEFTFEGRGKNDLYILQTREMSYAKRELMTVFIPTESLNENRLGTGIGVSGGATSGRIVFDVDDIKEFKQQDAQTPVILVRADTVPDDIVHIASADGILTARGGSTSHASIIATKLGKTCVVGFSKMTVYQSDKKCRIGKRILKKGDFISIDGRNGMVYLGKHLTQTIYLSSEYF